MRLKTGRHYSLAVLGAAALIAVAVDGVSSANARQSRREERHTQSRAPGTPLLAVIALAQQRVSVYGASGRIMEAPVSTGARGHETPAGIYSILEKEEEHHSTLYDDASMPFMERLTWTGIAVHAGALPGYPASHGCTRLPYGFAQELYQVTKPGMRVVIVREDITPAEIEQPEMFNQKRPLAPEPSSFEISATGSPSEVEIQARLKGLKETKLAEAEAAKKRELKARSVAANKAAEAASAARLAEAAALNFARMEAASDAGERTQETVSKRTENGEAAGALAAAKIQAARLRLETAKAQAQAKIDAAAQTEEEAKVAAALSGEAAEAAEIARENAWPISIFISRKTQRLYTRRGREPVFESPVTIRDPDKMIGTFVFTALNYTATPGRMRWNVVSMYKNAAAIEPYSEAKREKKKHREAKPADITGARNAMQRLVIPQEALERISGALLPGSSLIISDEGTSGETGKDTDFIVFMSGEPQGGGTLRSAVMTQAGAAGERKRSHGQKRKTRSSFSRSRPHAASAVWRRREFSPFPSLFGF
ncbi:MAG: L,D-transpeptidase family protein [Rhodomicrobium sp.]